MECKKFKGCKFSSYHADTNNCQLFKTCNKFSTSCENCFSGEKTCPICEKEGQCQKSKSLLVSEKKDITECLKVW